MANSWRQGHLISGAHMEADLDADRLDNAADGGDPVLRTERTEQRDRALPEPRCGSLTSEKMPFEC